MCIRDSQYGVDVSAGNGVAIKIKDICQLFISAMASGATTMIAQNLGASKFERAKDAVSYTHLLSPSAGATAPSMWWPSRPASTAASSPPFPWK